MLLNANIVNHFIVNNALMIGKGQRMSKISYKFIQKDVQIDVLESLRQNSLIK